MVKLRGFVEYLRCSLGFEHTRQLWHSTASALWGYFETVTWYSDRGEGRLHSPISRREESESENHKVTPTCQPIAFHLLVHPYALDFSSSWIFSSEALAFSKSVSSFATVSLAFIPFSFNLSISAALARFFRFLSCQQIAPPAATPKTASEPDPRVSQSGLSKKEEPTEDPRPLLSLNPFVGCHAGPQTASTLVFILRHINALFTGRSGPSLERGGC